MTRRGRVDRAVFPPEQVAAVTAIACELPASEGVPLSRLSRTELHRLVIERGVSEASATTIWRRLHDAGLKPWQQRSWIFPRDPDFEAKATRVLDLYESRWEGKLLHPGEFVISADEKTQLQALGRRHPTLAPAAGRPMLVEHEYRRGGTLAYMAALDIGRRGRSSRRPRIFGRCEPKTGIEPFDRLVEQVMGQAPYASAKRVFWVVDNGCSHAGQRSIDRLEGRYANLVLVPLPVHASWLNQIEIYFSILQRKALTPNDLGDLDSLERRILGFQEHWQAVAEPFEWNFTRRDLAALMEKLSERQPQLKLVA
jgi:hypothetical protein